MLPTEFTIGGRDYELVPFLKEGECIARDTLDVRAKELSADLGQGDGQFILQHQDEIPREFEWNIHLVIANWRDPSDSQCIAFLDYRGDHWCQYWTCPIYDYDHTDFRLVRRRPSTNPA